jgi:hypothetical protein
MTAKLHRSTRTKYRTLDHSTKTPTKEKKVRHSLLRNVSASDEKLLPPVGVS